jgi:hypothetical protein
MRWNVKKTDFNTVYNIKTPVSTPWEHNRDFLLFYLVAWWVRSRYTTTEFQYSEMHTEHISIHLKTGQEEKIYDTYTIFKESKFRKAGILPDLFYASKSSSITILHYKTNLISCIIKTIKNVYSIKFCRGESRAKMRRKGIPFIF